MAYPYVAAAYGFKPANLVGGRVYSGSTRMVPIQSAYGTNIFDGDIVQLNTAATFGTLISTGMSTSTASPVAGTLGIFVGCEYSSPAGPIFGKNRYQYWGAATAAQDALAYVVDDPQAIFRAVTLQQSTSLSNTVTAVGYLNPYYVGSNLYAVTGSPGTTAPTFSTGDSSMGVCSTVISSGSTGSGARITSTLPFRCVGIVPDTAISFQGTGSTSGSSATVTMTAAASTYGPTLPGASAPVGIVPGMQVICTASGTVRTNVSNYATVINASSTTLTLDSAVTLPASSVLTFVGYPEVLVSWNFGYNAYFNATGA